jgi:tetratricopeptide (TPR) repeat protein
MKIRALLIIFLTTVRISVSAQTSPVDSLQTLIAKDKADTFKLIHLLHLAEEYQYSGENEKSILTSKKMLDLSNELLKETEIKNDSVYYKSLIRFKARSIAFQAGIARETGKYSEALKLNSEALELRRSIRDKKGIGASLNNMGNVYEDMGNYPEALNNYLNSLKIKEAIGDKKGMGNSYNNIGNVYNYQGNHQQAIRNHVAALKLRQEIGDERGIAYSYNNIGNSYFAQAISENDPIIKKIKLELSLKNHLSSLKIASKIADKYGLGNSYVNIGGIYYENSAFEKDPQKRTRILEEALTNFYSGLQFRIAIDDKAGITACYTNIGMAFLKLKKFKEARSNLKEAENLAKEIGNKECLKQTYEALTKLDSINNDFKSAFENHKNFILYRDSLDNEESRKKMVQNQLTYDFEKKEAVAKIEHKKELEKQQLLADEKSHKQKTILILLSCFLGIVAFFAVFIYRSLMLAKKQKKIIEEQKELVEIQKKEVELQKKLIEEHRTDIISSITYARRIQVSQMPTEKYINNALKRLKNG